MDKLKKKIYHRIEMLEEIKGTLCESGIEDSYDIEGAIELGSIRGQILALKQVLKHIDLPPNQ